MSIDLTYGTAFYGVYVTNLPAPISQEAVINKAEPLHVLSTQLHERRNHKFSFSMQMQWKTSRVVFTTQITATTSWRTEWQWFCSFVWEIIFLRTLNDGIPPPTHKKWKNKFEGSLAFVEQIQVKTATLLRAECEIFLPHLEQLNSFA